MIDRNGQRGMTLIGWLLMLAMLGFLVLIAIRLSPAYVEYGTIAQAMEQAHASANADTTTAQVRDMLVKRFVINNVTTIRAHDIKIQKVEGNFTLSVAYEFRTPMMANVDAVVMFEKVVGEN